MLTFVFFQTKQARIKCIVHVLCTYLLLSPPPPSRVMGIAVLMLALSCRMLAGLRDNTSAASAAALPCLLLIAKALLLS